MVPETRRGRDKLPAQTSLGGGPQARTGGSNEEELLVGAACLFRTLQLLSFWSVLQVGT